jgi:hypothetical protein
MKLMMTHDELEGALRRLTSAGRVQEVAHHKFVEADGDPTSHSFSGITIDEQHEAEEAYRRAFWETYRSQQT